MLRCGVSAVVLLLGAAPAAFGQSVQVNLFKIEEVDRGGEAISVKQTLTQYQAVTKQVEVNVNGQIQVRQVTEMVPVMTMATVKLPLNQFRPHTGDGKPLEGKKLRDRLRPGAVVVVGGEELLQPQFRALFRSDALLLVGKKAAPPPPGR